MHEKWCKWDLGCCFPSNWILERCITVPAIQSRSHAADSQSTRVLPAPQSRRVLTIQKSTPAEHKSITSPTKVLPAPQKYYQTHKSITRPTKCRAERQHPVVGLWWCRSANPLYDPVPLMMLITIFTASQLSSPFDTLIREKFNSEDVNQPIIWPTTSDDDYWRSFHSITTLWHYGWGKCSNLFCFFFSCKRCSTRFGVGIIGPPRNYYMQLGDNFFPLVIISCSKAITFFLWWL